MIPKLLCACSAALATMLACSPPPAPPPAAVLDVRPSRPSPERRFVVTSDPALQVDRVDWIRGDHGTWYREECHVVREKRLDGSLEVRVSGSGVHEGAAVTFRFRRGPQGGPLVELVDQRDQVDLGVDASDVQRTLVAASGEIVLNSEDFFADVLACRYSFESEWRIASRSRSREPRLEKVHTAGEFALPYRP